MGLFFHFSLTITLCHFPHVRLIGACDTLFRKDEVRSGGGGAMKSQQATKVTSREMQCNANASAPCFSSLSETEIQGKPEQFFLRSVMFLRAGKESGLHILKLLLKKISAN